MTNTPRNTKLYAQIVALLQTARNQVVQTVNRTMVVTYYEIGRMIVEEEQKGEERAKYGKQILKELSKSLTKEFGKGFTVRNLELIRKFYLTYSKTKSPISKSKKENFALSWTHYIRLMRIDDENERKFYEIEAVSNNWSVRELQRQYDSALYTRLALSRNKDEIMQLSVKGHIVEKPEDVVKDPYVLEFLGLQEKAAYSESDLEHEIIGKLEHFLLELGKGFTFVARQKRISFDDKHFRIDLVFYNRLLKSFVLIDLKIGELKHQDIGQMQMYVNYYDREIRLDDENKTIGIILCQNKSEAVVEYTLPEDNKQIFASKYKTVLPSKKKLQELLKK